MKCRRSAPRYWHKPCRSCRKFHTPLVAGAPISRPVAERRARSPAGQCRHADLSFDWRRRCGRSWKKNSRLSSTAATSSTSAASRPMYAWPCEGRPPGPSLPGHSAVTGCHRRTRQRREAILRKSRERYGRPREVVERWVTAWYAEQEKPVTGDSHHDAPARHRSPAKATAEGH